MATPCDFLPAGQQHCRLAFIFWVVKSLTIVSFLSLNGLQISISLKRTLKDLKVAISQSGELGNIPVERMRLFHFGRELKTSGRSLEALGVGREGFTVLHVHATPAVSTAPSNGGKAAATSAAPAASAVPAAASGRAGRYAERVVRSAPVASAAVAAAAAASFEESPEVEVVVVRRRSKRQSNSPPESVVDLAEDSDDDDDCVVVEPVAAATPSRSKRPRRNA
jgi:hypothetical protein